MQNKKCPRRKSSAPNIPMALQKQFTRAKTMNKSKIKHQRRGALVNLELTVDSDISSTNKDSNNQTKRQELDDFLKKFQNTSPPTFEQMRTDIQKIVDEHHVSEKPWMRGQKSKWSVLYEYVVASGGKYKSKKVSKVIKKLSKKNQMMSSLKQKIKLINYDETMLQSDNI